MSKRSPDRSGADTESRKQARSGDDSPRRVSLESHSSDNGCEVETESATDRSGATTRGAAVADTLELVKLLDSMQKENATTVEKASSILKNLLNKNKPNCKELFELQGLGVLVTTLKKWKHNEGIQKSCLACTQFFVFDVAPSLLQPALNALIKMQGVEHIVGVLRKFSSNRNLQFHGISLLGNLFRNGNTQIAKDTAIKFVNDLNGFRLVISAMRRFRDFEALNSFACWLFEKFTSFNVDFKEKMLDSGVLKAVAYAKTAHPKVKDINDNTIAVAQYICCAD